MDRRAVEKKVPSHIISSEFLVSFPLNFLPYVFDGPYTLDWYFNRLATSVLGKFVLPPMLAASAECGVGLFTIGSQASYDQYLHDMNINCSFEVNWSYTWTPSAYFTYQRILWASLTFRVTLRQYCSVVMINMLSWMLFLQLLSHFLCRPLQRLMALVRLLESFKIFCRSPSKALRITT